MFQILLLAAAVLFIVLATAWARLHPFLALVLAAFGYGVASGMELCCVVTAVNEGFGKTVGGIGIIILSGAIIGVFLEKSGGAMRLGAAALGIVGRKNAAAAMSAVGFVVSLPVFCDSGFILLSPLAKALARTAKVPAAGCAVALSLGLYATHTMVPPTPGPIAAAGLLKADLGLVILCGLCVSVPSVLVGWAFAVIAGRHVTLASESDPLPDGTAAESALDEAPGVIASLLPIFVPILLILAQSVANLPPRPIGEGRVFEIVTFAGQPTVALLLGVFLAAFLPRRISRDLFSTSGWVGQAITSAGSIIVITGAGGAFGEVLRASGIDAVVKETFDISALGILLPFVLAAGLKTAQGSSTVAMIATAGIIAPMMTTLGLDSPSARALAVVAVGAGAMVVSHANDSYFWVVTQFSGMTPRQGYRLQTLGTLVEGTAAAGMVWVLYRLV